MKKFLLTAALVLALVTSLTAGTMAFYTTTVSTTSDVHTQKFEYTVLDSSSNTTEDINIIPGDTMTYRFTVKNNSEIDILSTLNYSLLMDDGMTAAVSEIEGLSIDVTRAVGTGASSSYASGTEETMVVGQLDTYVVTIEWDYNLGDRTDSDKELQLVVSANGKQAGTGSSTNMKSIFADSLTETDAD